VAARFWVGGTNTWDSTTTANWSATSGGAGGASVPGAADDVTIDTASITVTTDYNVSVISVTINASAATLSLGGTLTCSSIVTLTQGTFTTNNFNVTATQLSSNNSNTRTINLGSSTLTFTGFIVVNFTTSTGLTFNAGTSNIVCSSTGPSVVGGGLAFYDIQYTSTAITNSSLENVSSARNITVAGRAAAGVSGFVITANTTISGTLTLSAGTDATCRTFVRSNPIGTTRTLTCAAVAAPTDIDFRDITIAGAAAPVSGTRLGDAKGNSGITFGAGTTKYWNLAAGGNWNATGWATSSGGTPAANNFPLAQDTALFEATGLNSGATITISLAYNIGTIDMSARTGNTMTMATGTTTLPIYGNWINGTGTTLTGIGNLIFTGPGSQTLTNAGRTFTQTINISKPGGVLTLLDAFLSNRNNVGALTITTGTFDANNYNVTLTGSASAVSLAVANVRTVAIGSGTWTLSGITAWNVQTSANLTITGTGTISLISASSKNFVGGGIQTYPTLNQGGTGTLRVLGSNKFANITNTAIGRVEFDPGQTNIFTAFNLNGVSGNLLQLGANTAAQTTLQKSNAWLMGANSTDGGNNTGLSFTAGGGIDYLSVSYINGTVVAPPGNFLMFF
jgi:hypothetical protein